NMLIPDVSCTSVSGAVGKAMPTPLATTTPSESITSFFSVRLTSPSTTSRLVTPPVVSTGSSGDANGTLNSPDAGPPKAVTSPPTEKRDTLNPRGVTAAPPN